MTNETNGMLDTLNQDGAGVDTSNNSDGGESTKVEDDSEKKYLSQKIRAEKAEKALAELKSKLETKEKVDVTDKTVDASLNRLDEVEQKVELRMSGYSREEIAFAEKLAKGSGMKLSEIINDSYFKKAIEGSRAENKASANTPEPSSRTATFKGRPASEIFTDPKASKEEKQAAFNAVMSKKGLNKFN